MAADQLAAAQILHQQLVDALCTRDIAALKAILDPGVVLTHMSGLVQTRQEWIDEIMAQSMRYFSFQIQNETLTDGVYTVTTMCDANIRGTRGRWRLGLRYHFNPEITQIQKIIAFSW